MEAQILEDDLNLINRINEMSDDAQYLFKN